jgi:pyridoxamine 5'-phosphate oxidase
MPGRVSLIDFRTPAAGFDQPLALWQACHDRIARVTGLLERLSEHLKTFGADDAARTTAASVRQYFDEAAPRHHEDEDVDLYPRLRTRLRGKRARPVLDAIESLQADHRQLDALWRTLRETLAAIARGEPAELDPAAVAVFVSGYRRHCEVEDALIAPALARVLSAEDLAQIGRAMASRRGVDWDELCAPR